MTTETTALSLPQRAAIALGTAEHEIRLRELVLDSARIVEVKNGDAREEAHRAAMNLKNARTAITKTGKAAREDATAFSKAIILEEARLIGIVEPEEERVFKLRDAWDAAIQAEKDAKIAAERKRIESIQADIQSIRDIAIGMIGKTSGILATQIEIAGSLTATEARFAEFLPFAEQAIAETKTKLNEMFLSAKAAEDIARQAELDRLAEIARMAAEREELARQKAEAEKQRLAHEADMAAARKKQDDELAAERAERDRIRQLEDDKRAADVQRQREAIEAQNAEMRLNAALLQQQKNEIAMQQAADEKAAADALAGLEAQAASSQNAPETPLSNSELDYVLSNEWADDAEIIRLVADSFDVSEIDALARIEKINFDKCRVALLSQVA